MNLNSTVRAGLTLACLGSLLATTPAAAETVTRLYDPASLAGSLQRLQKRHPERLTLSVIGQSHEARPLIVARLGPKPGRPAAKTAMLAVFAEHADEHDMTVLGMGLIERLLSVDGEDERITRLLDQVAFFVMPMMNPDGAQHELSGKAVPFQWRKNRRPLPGGGFGVNLNRNWGFGFGLPVKGETQAPNDPAYPGDRAFSENETRAVRDFLVGEPRIKTFLDYHSGQSGFNQGVVLYPFASTAEDTLPKAVKAHYVDIAGRFAGLMTVNADRRDAFRAVQSWQVGDMVRAYITQVVPPSHREQALKSLPSETIAPGASIDWTHDTLKLLSLGVEISRPFPAKTVREYEDGLKRSFAKSFEGYLRGFVGMAEISLEEAEAAARGPGVPKI